MQLTKLVCLLPLIATALAAAVPEANPEADPGTRVTSDLVDEPLDKRACTYNNCACRSGTSPGVYCGWCYAVTAAGNGGSWGDAYQCSSSGSCCRYGARSSCASPANYSPCG
ncbi:hypothetical protein ABW20_dc0107544 [Dactylellina cionopaga]|nr:hypothetical protein ABW20_dc0107544 [Dactylellina cionopaga]